MSMYDTTDWNMSTTEWRMVFYGEYYYPHFSFILQAWLTATNAIAQSLSQVQASYALIKFKTNEVCFHIIMPHQSIKH